MDKELLGKCGYYCGQCPSFLEKECLGCVQGNASGVCYAIDCAIQKELVSCGHCKNFPCYTIQTDPKATLLSPLWLKQVKERHNSLFFGLLIFNLLSQPRPIPGNCPFLHWDEPVGRIQAFLFDLLLQGMWRRWLCWHMLRQLFRCRGNYEN